MLFGIWYIDNIEYYCGMMMVIVFELIVKLVVFFCVGVFIVYLVWCIDGLEFLIIVVSIY